MAVRMRNKLLVFAWCALLGASAAWAGLESGTYISDLVVTNPLTSDLASTSDDHLRLIKSTIKNTFPSINNVVNSSDEELNMVDGLTGTIWSSGNDGLGSGLDADLLDGSSSAAFLQTATYQALAPTWTDQHTFTRLRSAADQYAALFSSNNPFISWRENDAAANNGRWLMGASTEQWSLISANDTEGTQNTIMAVDRTGATVDQVAFPTEAAGAFRIGTVTGTINSGRLVTRTTTASASAINALSPTAATYTIYVQNEATAGNNSFVSFGTEPFGSYTERGSISYNRAGGTTSFTTTSDVRLKTNIQDSKPAGDLIDQIRIVSFDWRQGGAHLDHWVVAQELWRVAPQAVLVPDDPDAMWSVDVSKLVPLLVKEVQSLRLRVRDLEAAQAAH
jgi:hypothetical protein